MLSECDDKTEALCLKMQLLFDGSQRVTMLQAQVAAQDVEFTAMCKKSVIE